MSHFSRKILLRFVASIFQSRFVFFNRTLSLVKVGNRRVWDRHIAPTRMLIRVPRNRAAYFWLECRETRMYTRCHDQSCRLRRASGYSPIKTTHLNSFVISQSCKNEIFTPFKLFARNFSNAWTMARIHAVYSDIHRVYIIHVYATNDMCMISMI